jgi:glutamine synthetase
VDALPQIVTKECVGLFEKYKILNERELHARYEIFLENYNKTINIEGQLMVLMANRYILPAALEYQKQIALSVGAVRAVGAASVQAEKLLTTYTGLVDRLKADADALAALLEHEGGGAEAHAAYMRDTIVPAMAGAAGSGRCHRSAHAARALAAAHLPGDAVRQVATGGRRGPIPPPAVTSP